MYYMGVNGSVHTMHLQWISVYHIADESVACGYFICDFGKNADVIRKKTSYNVNEPLAYDIP